MVSPGPTEVIGYALAGDGQGISRVEVSLDRGRTWQPAILDEECGPWAWRQWQMTVHLPAGDVQILARAWDTTGASQPESAEQLWNPKGYLNNSWARVGVTVV